MPGVAVWVSANSLHRYSNPYSFWERNGSGRKTTANHLVRLVHLGCVTGRSVHERPSRFDSGSHLLYFSGAASSAPSLQQGRRNTADMSSNLIVLQSR